MPGPRTPDPNDTASAAREDKRRLDDALEVGLEDTFPASDAGQHYPAGALKGGSPRQAALSAAFPAQPARITKNQAMSMPCPLNWLPRAVMIHHIF